MFRNTLACAIGALSLLGTSAAVAGADFGSQEEAQNVAETMVKIIQDGGVDAGIAAMHDAALPFATSEMGIHVFESAIIVADNREPELIAASYAEIQDLTEEAMWPRIVEAADRHGEAVLKWYHYDTEEIYDYHCHSEWATAGEVLVMVCR